jgi:hypothetical protein
VRPTIPTWSFPAAWWNARQTFVPLPMEGYEAGARTSRRAVVLLDQDAVKEHRVDRRNVRRGPDETCRAYHPATCPNCYRVVDSTEVREGVAKPSQRERARGQKALKGKSEGNTREGQRAASKKSKQIPDFWAVSSVGERLLDTEEVRSSILLPPTIL